MKYHNLLLTMVLLIVSTSLSALNDQEYEDKFKKMWDTGCNTDLKSVEVDDIIQGNGRWKQIYFTFTYDRGCGIFGCLGEATYLAKMEITKDDTRIRCAVENISSGITLCSSSNCNWLN